MSPTCRQRRAAEAQCMPAEIASRPGSRRWHRDGLWRQNASPIQMIMTRRSSTISFTGRQGDARQASRCAKLALVARPAMPRRREGGAPESAKSTRAAGESATRKDISFDRTCMCAGRCCRQHAQRSQPRSWLHPTGCCLSVSALPAFGSARVRKGYHDGASFIAQELSSGDRLNCWRRTVKYDVGQNLGRVEPPSKRAEAAQICASDSSLGDFDRTQHACARRPDGVRRTDASPTRWRCFRLPMPARRAAG